LHEANTAEVGLIDNGLTGNRMMEINVVRLTEEQRAVWGRCAVCNAMPGMKCDLRDIKELLEPSPHRRKPLIAHAARINSAPRIVRASVLELPDAQGNLLLPEDIG